MDKLIIDRNYECFCGNGIAFDYAASYILEHTDKEGTTGLKIAVVSDRVVSGYYYNRFENQFIERGIKPVLIPVECSDSGKNLSAVESIFKYLTDFDFGSSDWIIALGGGGIIDVTGFVVSTFNNGINFMVVPTTLGAMCEGSIAAKALLNAGSHKDELATAFRPNIVIDDPSFLKTLPEKYKHNGYAPIIRYAMLDNTDLISDLEHGEPKDLREYLNKVYAARAHVEAVNPKLLDMGCEIAEAIESYFRFMNYTYGEALALSILASVDERRREPLRKIYESLSLPTKLEGVSGKTIIKTLQDRLNRRRTTDIDMIVLDSDARHWLVRKIPVNQAMVILAKRIAAICDMENMK